MKGLTSTMSNGEMNVNNNTISSRVSAKEKKPEVRFSFKDVEIALDNISESGTSIDSIDQKTWRWSTIKQQFAGHHLDPLFKIYTHKTNHGYLSTFLVLMCILSLAHFFLLLILNMEERSLDIVSVDLIVYLVVGILSIVGLYISEKFIKKRPQLLVVISTFGFFVLLLMNITVPVYHFCVNNISYRPAYTTLFVLSCYVFFNVTSNIRAAGLGFIMSVIHMVILAFVTYSQSDIIAERIGSDAVYLFCINAYGIYFRLLTEIMKRRSFLDTRVLVESTLRLKYEKEQGEQLIASIIPQHAIENVRKQVERQVEFIKNEGKFRISSPWEFDIQQHHNVTILYADIVNYTKMTTTLKSVYLVDTLNELFGRFDDASEDLKVLRVKFLGDCYYCVAGLESDNTQNHAEACVDLGLKMINIIQDVKVSRDLPIDMRIGIHSGNIFSGVIGACKWQFDIWSKDVSIANRMETTGKAGKVHITKQTKDQLHKTYQITPSDAGIKDVLLMQSNIETFLITPEIEPKPAVYLLQANIARKTHEIQDEAVNVNIYGSPLPQRRDSKFIQNRTPSNTGLMNARIVGRRQTPSSRRTAFMDSNIKRYHDHLQQTDQAMKESIEKLSLTKYDQWVKVKQINPLSLMFKNYSTEMDFVKLPDPLFKLHIVGVIVILVCIVLVQNITKPASWVAPIGYIAVLITIFIIFPLTWSEYIWNCCAELPKNDSMKKYILSCSAKISKSVTLRAIIYVLVLCISTITVMFEMIECNHFNSNNTSESDVVFRPLLVFRITQESNESCIVPWHMIEAIALVIVINFIFIRMHLWLKLVFACSLTILYSSLIWNFNDNYFMNIETYNHAMDASLAHIMGIVFLTVALYTIDRQTDFMSRLNHMLKLEQTEKQNKALSFQMYNEKLINNILPIHVAKQYLDTNRELGRLYYEEYSPAKPVAVMFAAISLQTKAAQSEPNVLDDETFLTCMNAHIEDYDQVLMKEYENKIEKIKIANWTYMCACGLDPGKRDSFFGNHVKGGERENFVVINLLEFAAKIMKLPHDGFLDSVIETKLRIGISHGEVTAGVVGSKKPLYDIWGDAVNMASRMESTGLVGCIQVTENTAMIARKLGYSCKFRGYMTVKGKEDNMIPTYFVEVDTDGNLVKEKEFYPKVVKNS